MSFDIPESWLLTTIEDIAKYVQRGKSPKYVDWSNLPVVNQKSIRWHGIEIEYLKFIHPDQWNKWNEERFLQKGDVLWNSTGIGTIGRATIYQGIPGYEKAVVDSHVTVVRIKKYNQKLLHYWIMSPTIQSRINKMHAGSTAQVELSKSEVLKTPIPLPPLNEQRRIVAKIEALKARSQRVKEALEAIPPLIDQFRQSVLAAAFRGDLTADWREKNPDVEPASVLLARICAERHHRWEEAELDKMKATGKKLTDDRWKEKYKKTLPINQEHFPKLPENWYWARVEELVSDIPRSIQSGPFGSNLLHSEFQDTGVLAIGIDNVLDGDFTLGRNHRINYEKYKELEKYTARPFDVLITVMATVGRCCVVPSNIETAIITKHVYRLSPECELIASHFLMNTLRGSEEVLRQMYGKIRGQTRPGINGEILRNLAIPVPPRLEQEQILLAINTQFASVERVFGMLNELGDAVLLLDQSILAKAFRGELVPQDPNDEPTSVLLERIRAERAKQEAEAKAVKKPTGNPVGERGRKAKQQDTQPNQLGLPGLE